MGKLGVDPRVSIIFEMLTAIATGDSEVKGAPIGNNDEYDAIINGLRMLSEELNASREEVEEMSRHYESLFNSAPCMYIIARNEGGRAILQDCNQAFEDALGYKKGDIIGKPFSFYTEESEKELYGGGGFQRALAGVFGEEERELVRSDGTVMKVLVRAKPDVDEKDNVTGTRATFMDVSILKEVQDALSESEGRYRQLVESMREGLIVLDSETEITFVNPRFCEFSGYAADELIGKPFRTMLSEENRAIHDAQIERRKRGEAQPYEIQITSKLGRAVDLYVAPTAFLEDGEFLGASAIMTDITARKRLERQLLITEKLASVGELAAGLSHQLRNPLGIISSSAQLALSKPNDSELIQETLEVIQRNADSANGMIFELLNFAKPRQYKMKEHTLSKTLNRAFGLMKADFVRRGVRIEKNYSTKRLKAVYDEDSLVEVMLNLLRNSLDAVRNGGTVSADLDRVDGRIIIDVEDDGEGISEENQMKVFDPFFTTKDDGTGLGLAICHRVMHQHNGIISIHTQEGKGTKVSLSMPIEGGGGVKR